ncbi:MAG: hypothetical protein A3G34_00350 [Candidatus Lindowbacteria bacterium RIFCSPLOWO2_12_FULL_62_27]|nr:MAG: hypothetical protein A3G34_00350 [Candidatus Lindowbacteria bacterium RIFCSPLOWO2_12_FULL_62_27]OGH63399.1 MAG: hypothetical protein A3I06_08430 [Candidatus Lindowbacteria bacterium RIFCSPLOWO2_02_FULL_62_12]
MNKGRIFLALIGAAILAACGSKLSTPGAADKPAAGPPPPLVEVAPVATERMVETIETVGTLEASEVVQVKPEVAGRIVRLGFDEGQTVKKGDILVELDPAKLQQDIEVASARLLQIRQTVLQQRKQLASARAQILQAQAGIDQARQTVRETLARRVRARAVLERARQDENRTRALFEKEFKTQDDLERAITTVKQAEADVAAADASLSGVDGEETHERHPLVKQARAALAAAHAAEQALQASLGDAAGDDAPVDVHPEVQRAQAELNLQQARMNDLTLIAPMDGVLSVRRVAVGDFVDKGALMFELVDLSSVKSAFHVPERYLSRIRSGQAAELRVTPWPDDLFRGTVYYIDPTVDEKTRSVLMKMRIQNPSRRLKPGLFADVRITVGDFPDARVVPESAIVPQGGKFHAFVIEGGVARMREVTLGLRRPGKVQILDGLHEGESVVVAGIQKIRDGIPVRIQEPAGR